MRVCVLSDEAFGDYTPESYLTQHEWKMYLVKRPTLDFIRAIAQQEEYEVYLNLCDGAPDEDRPGLDVVQALEALNLPFTGADSLFYSVTREQMRLAAQRVRVGFPPGFAARPQDPLETMIEGAGLRFPLIVKHPESYASVGMTRDSRVETMEQARARFDEMCALYGGARVEEFIEGREFTVLIADNPDNLADPYVYRPLEILFPPGESFKHWAMKFDPDADMDLVTVDDPLLERRLKTMVHDIYLALGGTGYARADIRMDPQGKLFLLEINPNPSIFNMPHEKSSADYMIEDDPGGVEGFLDRIFRSAILRRERRMLPGQLLRPRKLAPIEMRR